MSNALQNPAPFKLERVRRQLAVHQPTAASRDADTKVAAVALILRPALQQGDGHPQILLIRRAEHPDDRWSGQMAFPGGGVETSDFSTLHASIRETEEEVGLTLSPASHLGQLSDMPAVARSKQINMLIVPHVFAIEGDPALRINPAEVDRALWIDVRPLVSGHVDAVRPYVHEGTALDLPAFDVKGDVIWGLTYSMLRLLFTAALW